MQNYMLKHGDITVYNALWCLKRVMNGSDVESRNLRKIMAFYALMGLTAMSYLVR